MTFHKNFQSTNMAVVGGAKFFLAFGASSLCILRPCVNQKKLSIQTQTPVCTSDLVYSLLGCGAIVSLVWYVAGYYTSRWRFRAVIPFVVSAWRRTTLTRAKPAASGISSFPPLPASTSGENTIRRPRDIHVFIGVNPQARNTRWSWFLMNKMWIFVCVNLCSL